MEGFMSYWSTSCEASQHASWGAKLSLANLTGLHTVRKTQLFVHFLGWNGASFPSHIPQLHKAHTEAVWFPGSPIAALGPAHFI